MITQIKYYINILFYILATNLVLGCQKQEDSPIGKSRIDVYNEELLYQGTWVCNRQEWCNLHKISLYAVTLVFVL